MKKHTILFDLDGTLIDSTDAIVSTFLHSFEELNYDFKGEEEDIKSLIGYPLNIMYAKLGIHEEDVWDFVASYKNRYKKISKAQTLLLKDSVEALKLASSFARLSIVTTKTGKYTIPLLEHLDILKYFEIITGYENVENHKPHEEPILKTLELMNIKDKTNVWMVGDTYLDLESASNAKVNSVGVLCGYGTKESLLKYSSNVVENSKQAVEFIQNLIK